MPSECPTCGAPHTAQRCQYCRTWLGEQTDSRTYGVNDCLRVYTNLAQMIGLGLISQKHAESILTEHTQHIA